MRLFLAGIMQGSHAAKRLHDQDYRAHLKALLAAHLPELDLYDPLSDHNNSLEYGPQRGREVFFHHNRMCRAVDVLLAFVPEASMGTAIEMWEAHQHGAAVISISPLKHNWAVRFLSHARYDDLEQFAAALAGGEVLACIRAVRAAASGE
jgi:hypothetical protein